MKSILLSVRPEWVAKILNGKKTIEIRKTSPKCDLPIDVYIYCTKGDYLHHNKNGWFVFDMPTTFIAQEDFVTVKEQKPFNGKVVAKFTLREVEEMEYSMYYGYTPKDHESSFPAEWPFWKRACITHKELWDYGNGKPRIYAWYISDLVIFDKPKELSDFMKPNWDDGLDKALEQARKEDAKIAERIHNGDSFDGEIDNCEELTLVGFKLSGRITKAPKSWCYVEESK